MAEIKIMVMGGNGDPFEIVFSKDGDEFRAKCSCGFARKKQLCEHQVYVLEGGSQRVMGSGRAEVPKVLELLAGTKAEEMFKAVVAAEEQFEKLKKEITKKKKDLGLLLVGAEK